MGVGDYTRFRPEFTKRPGHSQLEAPVPPKKKGERGNLNPRRRPKPVPSSDPGSGVFFLTERA